MGLRMLNGARVLCLYCDKKMEVGEAFCPTCAHPTEWATHDERVRWELQNYRTLLTRPIEGASGQPGSPRPVSLITPRTRPIQERAHERIVPRAPAIPQHPVERPAQPRPLIALTQPIAAPPAPAPTIAPPLASTIALAPPSLVEPTPPPVVDILERTPLVDRMDRENFLEGPIASLLEEEVTLLRELVTRVAAIENHIGMNAARQKPVEALRRLRMMVGMPFLGTRPRS